MYVTIENTQLVKITYGSVQQKFLKIIETCEQKILRVHKKNLQKVYKHFKKNLTTKKTQKFTFHSQ